MSLSEICFAVSGRNQVKGLGHWIHPRSGESYHISDSGFSRCSPRSLWKTHTNSDLFDFAREFVHAGSVVWDVGANVGLFSIAAAQRAGVRGKVVAIESDIWLAALLRKSAAVQPPMSARVQVIPAAVFDCLRSPHSTSRTVAERLTFSP